MEQPVTLKLACRFVPHDQWLVTHADPTWKVKTLKLSILTKCTILTPHSSNTDLPLLPKFRKRNPSPLTFSHDRKRRPGSPILFAPNARMQSSVLETTTTLGDTDISAGYEQDDEEDSLSDDPDTRLYRKHIAPEPTTVVSSRQGGTIIKPTSSHIPRDSTTSLVAEHLDPAYDPQLFTLVRFTTGQILDDTSPLDWYDLQTEELLELHPAGFIVRLPRYIVSEYIEPYWEGWVKSLRRIFEVDNRGQSRLEWRERWLVIQNGMITVNRSQDDTTPTQIVPLSALTSLQGPDRLTQTVDVTPEQRILCAKFEHVPEPENESEEEEGSAYQVLETNVTVGRSTSQIQHQREKSLPGGGLKSLKGVQVQIRQNTASASAIPISRKESAKKSASSNLRHRLSALSLRSVSGGSASTDYGKDFGKASTTHNPRWKRFSQRVPEEDEHPPGQISAQEGVISDEEDPDDQYAFSDGPIEFAPAESLEGLSDDSSNGSSQFSSPVFAPGNGPWEEGSDEGSDEERHSTRTSYGFYGYGYGSRTKERLKSGEKGKDSELEFDHITGDTSTVNVQGEDSQRSLNNKRRNTWRRSYREKEQGEWIVLDMIDQPAYTSILRILHRHARQPLSSSFTKSLPLLRESSSRLEDVKTLSNPQETSESLPNALNKLPALITDNLSSGYAQSHHHPSPLRANHKQSKTLGAAPYPEWRHEVTEKAQIRGLNTTGSLQTFYFGKASHVKAPATFPTLPNPTFNEAASQRSFQSSNSSVTVGREVESILSSEIESSDESEFEWHVWQGDLGRKAMEASNNPSSPTHPRSRRDYNEDQYVKDRDVVLKHPRSQAEDYEYLLNERLCLEPSASIYVEPPSPPRSPSPPQSPNVIHKRPMHDTSPMSNGRRNRTMSFGMTGHEHSTSVGGAANALLSLKTESPAGVSPVAIPQGFRRPSLPDLFPTPHSPRSSDKAPTPGASSLGKSLNIRRQVSSTQIGPSTMSRSLGKSSLGRVGSNLLRKKGSDPGEGFNAKKDKGKRRANEGDLMEQEREGRSQWTSVSPQGRNATSPGSPDFSSFSMHPPEKPGAEAESSGKKKKTKNLVRGMSKRADKIVKGLEPALNFVDGK